MSGFTEGEDRLQGTLCPGRINDFAHFKLRLTWRLVWRSCYFLAW